MPLDRYEKEEFFELLLNNPKLQKIITSIHYSMGHNVDMITTSSSYTQNLIVEYIQKELFSLHEPKKVITFSVKKRSDLKSFFEKLQEFSNRKEEYLFIFDFIGLDDTMEAEYIFMMINKERNRILEQLNSPILLFMSKEFKRIFAYSASDFWSVNKLTVQIELDVTDEVLVDKQNIMEKLKEYVKNLFFTKRKVILPESSELLRYKQELQVIEKELKKDPTVLTTQRLYLISLANLADYYQKNSSLNMAFKLYDKALLFAQKIQKKRPDSIEAKRDLSVSFYKISSVYEKQKDFDKEREELLKARAVILEFKDLKYGDLVSLIEFFDKKIEKL